MLNLHRSRPYDPPAMSFKKFSQPQEFRKMRHEAFVNLELEKIKDMEKRNYFKRMEQRVFGRYIGQSRDNSQGKDKQLWHAAKTLESHINQPMSSTFDRQDSFRQATSTLAQPEFVQSELFYKQEKDVASKPNSTQKPKVTFSKGVHASEVYESIYSNKNSRANSAKRNLNTSTTSASKQSKGILVHSSSSPKLPQRYAASFASASHTEAADKVLPLSRPQTSKAESTAAKFPERSLNGASNQKMEAKMKTLEGGSTEKKKGGKSLVGGGGKMDRDNLRQTGSYGQYQHDLSFGRQGDFEFGSHNLWPKDLPNLPDNNFEAVEDRRSLSPKEKADIEVSHSKDIIGDLRGRIDETEKWVKDSPKNSFVGKRARQVQSLSLKNILADPAPFAAFTRAIEAERRQEIPSAAFFSSQDSRSFKGDTHFDSLPYYPSRTQEPDHRDSSFNRHRWQESNESSDPQYRTLADEKVTTEEREVQALQEECMNLERTLFTTLNKISNISKNLEQKSHDRIKGSSGKVDRVTPNKSVLHTPSASQNLRGILNKLRDDGIIVQDQQGSESKRDEQVEKQLSKCSGFKTLEPKEETDHREFTSTAKYVKDSKNKHQASAPQMFSEEQDQVEIQSRENPVASAVNSHPDPVNSTPKNLRTPSAATGGKGQSRGQSVKSGQQPLGEDLQAMKEEEERLKASINTLKYTVDNLRQKVGKHKDLDSAIQTIANENQRRKVAIDKRYGYGQY